MFMDSPFNVNLYTMTVVYLKKKKRKRYYLEKIKNEWFLLYDCDNIVKWNKIRYYWRKKEKWSINDKLCKILIVFISLYDCFLVTTPNYIEHLFNDCFLSSYDYSFFWTYI